MKKYLIIGLFIIGSALLFSCDNFEGEQTVPAYIKVSGFNLVANPNYEFEQDENFLTSDISDVWIYVDNELLGAYALPKNGDSVTIPVLAKGRHAIDFRPGIKYNGMAATREYYRFYTFVTDTLDLIPGQITRIDKKDIMYNYTYAKFTFNYGFEDSFSHFENFTELGSTNNSQPNNFILITNDSVKYGNNCLAMYSTSKEDNYKIITKDSIICTNKNGIILELDYHSNIPFEVGLYGKSSLTNNHTVSVMRLKANEDKGWQKMYIILGKVWGQLSYNPFKIYFQPFNVNNVPNGYIHIDNLNLIHFPD
ncbi:MAG: hypothetical protein IJ213_03835 [Bacteroidales bacterium]|nr:hypothetical protein [Bacteroidales bacterium]